MSVVCASIVNFISPGTVTDAPGHLAIIRESPQGALGEHEVAIHRDLEDAVLALYQLNRSTKLVL